MNTEQLENIVNADQPVPTEATATVEAAPVEATTKRFYTRKEDMERGNQAILDVLATDDTGALSKAEILARLADDTRTLIAHNWNLRIALLEETAQVLTKGKKVAKKYWRAT